ncbi:uncharacterized protein METZ01_LOCUS104336, partial [marine metagenome]
RDPLGRLGGGIGNLGGRRRICNPSPRRRDPTVHARRTGATAKKPHTSL